MNIYTKYKIGDTVYFCTEYGIIKGEIKQIKANVDNKGYVFVKYSIYVIPDDLCLKKEDEIFLSIEELCKFYKNELSI